jgi:hypothetical protein
MGAVEPSHRPGRTSAGWPPQEQHLIRQPVRVGGGLLANRVGQGRELVPLEAGGNEDDPGVRLLSVHEVPDDLDEVRNVARDETSVLADREAELIEITAPHPASLVSAKGIEPALTEELCHPRRQILIEVQLHPAMRTRPG